MAGRVCPPMSSQGEVITPDLDFNLDTLPALVTVAHLQQTGRPIEDRYSANFDKSQNRLILGIYDGMTSSR
jgi:hypothetical protein